MNPVTLTGFWAVVYQTILWFSLIGSWVFPLWYGFTKPWYRSAMGQHLMAYSGVMAISMTLLAIRPLFGGGELRATPIGIVLVLLIGLLGWWRAGLFYVYRNRDD